MRHDGGRADYGNQHFKRLLKKYDIIDEETTGASTGNAKVERRIGIAKSDSLTNMSWSHTPRGWWTYSTKYSVVTRNLLPTSTNPGHMSPYEFVYDRRPDYSILVPFDCLAFVDVDNKKRKGKINYRNTSRTCAMIGYSCKPDGHPMGYGYILYDYDFGTVIKRPNNLVFFNPDMPALKYMAERAVKRPVGLYKNTVIAKFFVKNKGKNSKKVIHWGKVVSSRYDSDGELLFKINYERRW